MSTSAYTREQLERIAAEVPFWFHSIDLGEGVVTHGKKSSALLDRELRSLRLPNLSGKSVLDIGAWDGFFSFAAERMGASRVLALDHYVWSIDLAEHRKYMAACKERSEVPSPYHEMPYFRPADLPGMCGFNTARRALQSSVDPCVGDFMELDLRDLGTFNVVLYLGVLYHMENPLEALRRVFAVTKELAVIESEAVIFPGYEHHSLCEFFESDELAGDVSNWWAPNEKALLGMCRAAGFCRVETLVGPPVASGSLSADIQRYRAVLHAWK